MRRPAVAQRFAAFGTSIFAEITGLATRHGAVNLGQGFPDFDGPDEVKSAAIDAIRAGHNQYCRTAGIPTLCQAIAEHHRRFYGMSFDPETEVTVTAGATEAIFAAVIGLVDPGDEVVMFEPFYDSYVAAVAAAGAVPRFVTLRPGADGKFHYDAGELAAAFSSKTRMLLLNTPHNPTGKVFSRAELDELSKLVRRWDAICVTDEVYEHLVFDGEHVPMCSLLGMEDRTLTISSTGKTFSFTGWKIGFTIGRPELTAGVRAAHQFMTFCNGTPFQHAMARAFGLGDDYYSRFLAEYRGRRDRLCAGLEEVGFQVHRPSGTYFVMTDIRPLGFEDGAEFCRELPARAGVAAIPASAFYANVAEGRSLVRWAFCKSDAVLDESIRRLSILRHV